MRLLLAGRSRPAPEPVPTIGAHEYLLERQRA